MPKKFEVVSEIKKSKQALVLFNFRKKIGFSQAQLASEWNVSPGTIALWESDKRKIPGPVQKLIEIYKKEYQQ